MNKIVRPVLAALSANGLNESLTRATVQRKTSPVTQPETPLREALPKAVIYFLSLDVLSNPS